MNILKKFLPSRSLIGKTVMIATLAFSAPPGAFAQQALGGLVGNAINGLFGAIGQGVSKITGGGNTNLSTDPDNQNLPAGVAPTTIPNDPLVATYDHGIKHYYRANSGLVYRMKQGQGTYIMADTLSPSSHNDPGYYNALLMTKNIATGAESFDRFRITRDSCSNSGEIVMQNYNSKHGWSEQLDNGSWAVAASMSVNSTIDRRRSGYMVAYIICAFKAKFGLPAPL